MGSVWVNAHVHNTADESEVHSVSALGDAFMQVSEFIDNSMKAVHRVPGAEHKNVDIIVIGEELRERPGDPSKPLSCVIVADTGCGMNHSRLDAWAKRGTVPLRATEVRKRSSLALACCVSQDMPAWPCHKCTSRSARVTSCSR